VVPPPLRVGYRLKNLTTLRSGVPEWLYCCMPVDSKLRKLQGRGVVGRGSRASEDRIMYAPPRTYGTVTYVTPQTSRSFEAARQRERRARGRRFITKQLDAPCTDCELRYTGIVMAFYPAPGRFVGSSIATIRKELAKCDLLCANCRANRLGSARAKRT
jgi:hypothetical protein